MYRRNSLLLAFLALLATTLACTKDDDCSLNGICKTNNTTTICHCDPGWTGPDCGRLDLAPATRWTGYNHTNYTDPAYYGAYGNSSWGGRIIQDRDDPKLFHLLVDQFSHGCGLGGWRPTSFIVRAESRSGPQGPYKWVQNVTSSFRHNADVLWSPADRKYLLWAIGAAVEDPKTCKSIPGSQFPNNVSVSSASSIRGPWTPFHITINGTNPAPWPLYSPANKTSQIALAVEDFKIFTAPDWNGAFTRVNEDVAWNTTDYSPTWTEDPFIWRDKRGNWHALAHWMIDIVEKNGTKYPRVGAHMFSRRLESGWTFKVQEAFSSTVEFTDGAVETFNRRERSKIFFDEDMRPLYLVSGVQAMGVKSSFTLVQPIGKRWREYENELGF
ncbi:hypothetical protein DPSP01_010333 [Paraphaeosphaeria sporulosa]